MVYNLHNLASTIGWEVVNVDEGFINYEYVLKIGEIESLSYIVRISENPTPEYFEETFEALIQVCTQHRIDYQVRIAQRGGNDAGAVHLSKTGVPSCALSLPTRNIHSNVEVCATRDLQAMADLTFLCAQEGIKF